MDTPADLSTLRRLPGLERLLGSADGTALIARYGRPAVTDALRAALSQARDRLRAGDPSVSAAPVDLFNAAAAALAAAFAPTLRPVINATGIVLHTNLGRAPLSAGAQAAVQAAAAGYSTLEYDLTTGKRGGRAVHAEAALRAVTGAEAALVVNNNAAALVLMLTALATGREVIVSRGEAVEIGGGFRIPDVMAQSGARLVEVGTTNRTRAADYARAVTAQTAAVLRVHASNFKVIGFTERVPLEALARLAHERGLLALDDLGSGALIETAPFGLDPEPTVSASLAAGMDVIAFSGDKLLGGPQAGILVGKRPLIETLKRHPLARAVRSDKLTLAALAATLDSYRRGAALTEIPVWRMIARPADDLRAEAEAWAGRLRAALPAPERVTVRPAQSAVGGGSLPGTTLPTFVVALAHPAPDAYAARLRAAAFPVITRIADDAVCCDPRTVFAEQTDALLLNLVNAW